MFPKRDALVIQPHNSQKETLDRVAFLAKEIIGKLPHTPLLGVGHNFTYKLNESEDIVSPEILPSNDLEQFMGEKVSKNFRKIVSRVVSFKLSLNDHPYLLNLKIDKQEKLEKMSFNFHFEKIDDNRVDDVAYAIFNDNYKLSKKMVGNLTNGK